MAESTFGNTINLSTSKGTSIDLSIEASESALYIVWRNYTSSNGGSDKLLLKSSTDGGATFGDAVLLSEVTSQSGTFPQIAIAGNGNVYVVWCDDGVFFKNLLPIVGPPLVMQCY